MHASLARIGIDAERTLRTGGTGTVIASFLRSVYLRFPAGIVCLGDGTIGDGPLNLVCDRAARFWSIPLGGSARASGTVIELAGHRIDWAEAVRWVPPPVPVTSPETLAAGLDLLRSELPRHLADSGLCVLAVADPQEPRTPVARVAAVAGSRVAEWAIACGAPDRVPTDALEALLGLGPGLTPSGDDYLAGLSFCLCALGIHGSLSALEATILPLAATLTNEISEAHLAAALRGGLRADLHGMFNAVLAADRASLSVHLEALAAEAHSSPWDAVAGFVTAARLASARGTMSPSRTVDRPVSHTTPIVIGCRRCAA